MKTMTVTFKGRDSWSRPVYVTDKGVYLVDVDPNRDTPNLHTKNNNEIDGEPDSPIRKDIKIIFKPCRDTW